MKTYFDKQIKPALDKLDELLGEQDCQHDNCFVAHASVPESDKDESAVICADCDEVIE